MERKLLKDVDKLAKQPFGSAEASVLRNYLDTCMEMPWGEGTKERASVDAARKILDRDHYGLQKVKERILEILAVRKLEPDIKGRSSVWWARREPARPVLPGPLPELWENSMCGSAWAASETKRRSGDTEGLISGLCGKDH